MLGRVGKVGFEGSLVVSLLVGRLPVRFARTGLGGRAGALARRPGSGADLAKAQQRHGVVERLARIPDTLRDLDAVQQAYRQLK